MQIPPPPNPVAIVQPVDELKDQQRIRSSMEYFEHSVVAGGWHHVLTWIQENNYAGVFLESDLIDIHRTLGNIGSELSLDTLNITSYEWLEGQNNRPSLTRLFNTRGVIACAILQGRGAMRGAMIVCVESDDSGQPLNPSIFDPNYIQEVQRNVMFR